MLAAKYHCDAHVRKMVVEYSQLLSTAWHILKPDSGKELYKPTHVNHPCSVWVRSNPANYDWLYVCLFWLHREYLFNYNNHNASYRLIGSLKENPFDSYKPSIDKDFSEPPLAMPDYCKIGDAVESYREYYRREKADLLVYKFRYAPHFLSPRYECNNNN